MKVGVSLFVIVLISAISITNQTERAENCPEAARTVEYVETCPTSENEVKEAAKLKKCDILANEQSCTEASNFQFHCVINTFINATISVCAPKLLIKGRCAEYNVEGERIQDLYEVRCTNHSPPCPSIYVSTDAFKYDSCYKLVYNKRKESKSSGPVAYETTNANWATTPNLVISKTSESDISGLLIGVIVVLLVFVVILAAMVICMYLRQHRQPAKKVYGEAKAEEMAIILQDNEKLSDEADLEAAESVLQDNGQPETKPEKEHQETSILFEKEKTSRKIDQIATDSYTDRNVYVHCMDTLERKAEDNLEETRKYLREYKNFDKYFVETRLFEKIMHLLSKNGVAIISGPPGCGKTNAAIHVLLNETYAEWDKRKIQSCEQLSLIRTNKNTLVFIDNLFHDTSFMQGIDKWEEELNEIFEKSIKKFRGKNGIHEGGRVRLLITAKENVIEDACKYMKSTIPVFNEDLILQIKNEWCEDNTEEIIDKGNIFSLQKSEREKILKSQFEFAAKELKIKNENLENSVLKDIIESNGPVGFPLCAHLFACKLDYRAKSKSFFSDPTDYLRTEIENEICNDGSNRTKTLLFTMFVSEWHYNKEGKEKLKIDSENSCENFLKGVSEDLLAKFSPLEFTDLTIVAKNLCGAFLIEIEDGVFKFTHECVFEAVASYFCKKYFEQAADNFPLQILDNQENSSENEDRNRMLSLRFLYEIFSGKIAEVFSYKSFSLPSFVDCFFVQLRRRDKRVIKKFYDSTDSSSNLALPPTFWAGKAHLYYLTDKMLELAKEENINHDFHFYMTLFGECCSINEGLLKGKDKTDCDKNDSDKFSVKKLKIEVTKFKNENNDSILHLVVSSDRNDAQVCKIIEHMHLTKTISNIINERNKQNMLPIMSAFQCQNPRIGAIRKLVQLGAKVINQDTKRSTVVHYCLRSNIPDLTCSENLELLLNCNQFQKRIINFSDSEGETALNIAAKNNRYSRLLSILTLLDKCPSINPKTLNLDGFSPIHNAVANLKGNGAILNLERCARVAIFITYGVDPDQEADTFEDQESGDQNIEEVKGLTAKDVCLKMKYAHTERILNNCTNQIKMAEILEELFRTQKVDCSQKVNILNPWGKMTDKLKIAIEQAVRVLANVEFSD